MLSCVITCPREFSKFSSNRQMVTADIGPRSPAVQIAMESVKRNPDYIEPNVADLIQTRSS